MQDCADALLRNHIPVAVANLRGCGTSATLCSRLHHPGRMDDVADLLNGLLDQTPDLYRNGLVLVGMSMGGNLLLKFLAGPRGTFPIRGAVTVAAAIDLQETSRRLQQFENRAYEVYLLRKMREEVLRETANLSDEERRRVEEAGSIYEIDDTFTAPRLGRGLLRGKQR